MRVGCRYSAQYDGQRDVESWDLHEGKRDVTVCCAGPYAIARRQNLGTNGQGEIQWGARIWEPVHDIPRSAFKVRFQLEPQVLHRWICMLLCKHAAERSKCTGGCFRDWNALFAI